MNAEMIRDLFNYYGSRVRQYAAALEDIGYEGFADVMTQVSRELHKEADRLTEQLKTQE